MQVAIRVDASAQMGIGHMIRCLTLADMLRGQGARVRFVSRQLNDFLRNLIADRGHECIVLPERHERVGVAELAHSQWLTTDQATDADDVAAALADRKWDWLVVDHYGLDASWERRLRTIATRILAVDDLADREHDCDLLLDQNLVPEYRQRYLGKVPERCGMLLGPEFALLQSVYAQLRGTVQPRQGRIRRVLISFGAADNTNLTGKALAAFCELGQPDVHADVVLAPSMKHVQAVREQAAGHDNVTVHANLPTLAHLMANADLAIGAGGTTSWERLCLGLPALIVTLADNQRAPAMGLEQARLIRWLGHSDTASVGLFRSTLEELFRDGLDRTWSERCLDYVDGRGAARVSTAMSIGPGTPLSARPVTARDEHLLLVWANDPVARANAFATQAIKPEDHHRWLQGRLRSPQEHRLYIVETGDGVPVGQVRFDRGDDGRWGIDYSLAPMFRGRGCGRPLLETALSKLGVDEPGAAVCGVVKARNVASRRVFEASGFVAHSPSADLFEYRRQL